MAITRSQQAKQMLRKGGRIGFRIGSGDKDSKGRSYNTSGREYDRSPKQSTFSSEIEDEIVTRGDTTDRRETQKEREKLGFVPTGGEAKDQSVVTKRQRKNYEDQFTSKGIVPPGPNRKARQRALNYINRNMLINYNRFTNPPTNFLSPTGYPNFGIPNIYQGINEALAAGKTLNEILEEGNMIPIGKSGTSFEMNPIPDLDIDSIRELAAQQSKFGSLTGYQADSLEKLRNDIEKRDNFLETGDTSDIFPKPPEPTPDDRSEPLDPCLGPNPPAYCFIGENADNNMEAAVTRNLSGLTSRIGGSLFNFDGPQFAADGGRIGFKGGADMGTVSTPTRTATAKSVNISPSGNVTTSRDREPKGPDDRSTFEQTVNQRNVVNRAKTPERSGIEKLYRTGSELNFLRNLAIGNFPGLGKQLMFELGKKKFLDNQAMLNTEDDNMMLADLTDMQKKMLEGPQKNLKDIMGISNEEILQNIEKFNDPNAPATIQDIEEFYQQAKDGGLMSLNREAFLLGGIAKGLKKAVRGVKKLAKSPIGKAALLGAGFGLAGMGPMANLFSSGKGLAFKQLLLGGKTLPPSLGFKSKGLLGLIKANPIKSMLGASLLSGLMTAKQDDDEFDLASYYAQNQLTPSQSVRGMGSEFDFYGGPRMKVADGGNVEPVAKKTMPLLDMDGKEKDYRETGGFVDMGRMERADDVPARLSKNEFVFTADAVRNAGEGDIDKGAEVMYNMMKNLEAGGEVSEESQGLEGAREMFQTSQRLGEVI
jgi:hypothetical protein